MEFFYFHSKLMDHFKEKELEVEPGYVPVLCRKVVSLHQLYSEVCKLEGFDNVNLIKNGWKLVAKRLNISVLPSNSTAIRLKSIYEENLLSFERDQKKVTPREKKTGRMGPQKKKPKIVEKPEEEEAVESDDSQRTTVYKRKVYKPKPKTKEEEVQPAKITTPAPTSSLVIPNPVSPVPSSSFTQFRENSSLSNRSNNNSKMEVDDVSEASSYTNSNSNNDDSDNGSRGSSDDSESPFSSENEDYPAPTYESVVKDFQSLPPGWEKRRDRYGEAYYVDHINRKTQVDPPEMSTPSASTITTIPISSSSLSSTALVETTTKEPAKKYKCDFEMTPGNLCGADFVRPAELLRHNNTHLSAPAGKCVKCKRDYFANYAIYLRHQEKKDHIIKEPSQSQQQQ